MFKYNKYDFYQLNKKITTLKIDDALNDLITNKNINSNFELHHISSLDNTYPNSAVFINSNKEFNLIDDDKILIITENKKFFTKYKNSILVNDINKSYKALADYIYIHDDSLNLNMLVPLLFLVLLCHKYFPFLPFGFSLESRL